MSTLTVDFIISLDGYGAAEGWPAYWGLEGPEYLAWLAEDNQQELVHVMGANTYNLMSAFAGQSDAAESVALDESRKIVFSSTLSEPLQWSHSELVSSDAAEFVRELKRSETRELRTLGSVSLCRSLIAAGLVDRFRVVVFPVITGETGRQRIFDDYPDVALELVEARTFDGGTQLLHYVPTVLESPPVAV
ncbi:dihydrofolate reductase family protein [Microbacterium sp. PMB16]|uniref:dihydrofolate reductase family protein n=1 Tax=Microbacterium sp. PMB16 TaxID=3120157 RepID=UPI003F4C3471